MGMAWRFMLFLAMFLLHHLDAYLTFPYRYRYRCRCRCRCRCYLDSYQDGRGSSRPSSSCYIRCWHGSFLVTSPAIPSSLIAHVPTLHSVLHTSAMYTVAANCWRGTLTYESLAVAGHDCRVAAHALVPEPATRRRYIAPPPVRFKPRSQFRPP